MNPTDGSNFFLSHDIISYPLIILKNYFIHDYLSVLTFFFLLIYLTNNSHEQRYTFLNCQSCDDIYDPSASRQRWNRGRSQEQYALDLSSFVAID